MWQRRWFSLSGDTLAFYNTEQDAANGSTPKWTLDLGAHGASVSSYSEPGAPPDTMRIELSAGTEHFSFKADSEMEAEMWLSALPTNPRGGAAPVTPAASAMGGMFDGLGVVGGGLPAPAVVTPAAPPSTEARRPLTFSTGGSAATPAAPSPRRRTSAGSRALAASARPTLSAAGASERPHRLRRVVGRLRRRCGRRGAKRLSGRHSQARRTRVTAAAVALAMAAATATAATAPATSAAAPSPPPHSVVSSTWRLSVCPAWRRRR